MSIIADYTFQGIQLKDVYIRPQSIGGAKNYNWAASFAVFANQELSQDFNNHLEVITVTFPWVDNQNVYADAYASMVQHESLSNVRRG
jgi:hypothetical protein